MGYAVTIDNLLVNTAAAGAFTEATYTIARPSLLVEGGVVSPSSIEAIEVRGAFGIEGEYGRDFRQDRTGWAWLLRIRFDTAVILENFELSLLESPLTIPADPSAGRPVAYMLILEDSAYEHPPRGGASNGTEVTYRFVADPCH